MLFHIYLSVITASLSFTITETKIFAPLRQWLKSRSTFFGELFSCGYCLGHWIALVLVLIFKPRLFDIWWVFDYFCAVLIIAWIAGFQWVVMCLLIRLAGK
ncbi:hypothetical protein EH223_00190 [candidate division KSB1 bacterium]|nr:hypothetical protein [candidate division KSB1 bacterium]RQW07341.1 MAG: hypothetical protein EH223_00190 [candidate division KSB1 bacterium]